MTATSIEFTLEECAEILMRASENLLDYQTRLHSAWQGEEVQQVDRVLKCVREELKTSYTNLHRLFNTSLQKQESL